MPDTFVPTLTKPIALVSASPTFAAWVQKQLARGGYLPQAGIDGKVGAQSLKAFAEFKEDVYLADPGVIGQSSIDLLAALDVPDAPSEQRSLNVTPIKMGHTGRSIAMPLAGLVFANQEIVENGNLTWGEVFRNFERMPAGSATYGSEEDIVRNAIALAKAFRQVREKFGSPIAINSAYRPYFLKIGASKSQHKYCRGLDVRPINGEWKKLLDCIKAVDEIKGVGLGRKIGFWHMDIRPKQNRTVFPYA